MNGYLSSLVVELVVVMVVVVALSLLPVTQIAVLVLSS